MSSDAAKRAAARKAKILARGNTGLQKLAQTARGEQAEELYGESPAASTPAKSTPSTSRPTSPSEEAKPSWAPPPTSQSTRAPPAGAGAGMTAEQRQMQEQLAAMFGGLPPPGEGEGGMPDMSRMLAQMMGMDPSAFPGPGGQNLIGDLDDPAGLGGGAGGMPPNPFAGMPGFGAMGGQGMDGMPDFSALGGLGGLGGLPGMGMPGMEGQRGISKTQKYFPLIHAIAMVLLGVFCVVWWEPRLRATRWAGRVLADSSHVWSRRWAGLDGGRGWISKAEEVMTGGGVETLPLFWAFATVQLILHTTRIMILRSPPPPHSLISTFLPMLPPTISKPLITGSRYLNLLSQLWKDLAILLFFIGMTIIAGQWLSTGTSPIHLHTS